MDLKPIDDILVQVGVSHDDFEAIKRTRAFDDALKEELAIWTSAPNTAERIRYKYLTNIEEAAPLLYSELIDAKHPLNHRAELLKTMTRLAGLDAPKATDNASRVKITINMGAERPITVEHAQIDHDAEDADVSEVA